MNNIWIMFFVVIFGSGIRSDGMFVLFRMIFIIKTIAGDLLLLH